MLNNLLKLSIKIFIKKMKRQYCDSVPVVIECHLPSTMTDCFQIFSKKRVSPVINNNHFADKTGPYKHQVTTNRDPYEIVMKYLHFSKSS